MSLEDLQLVAESIEKIVTAEIKATTVLSADTLVKPAADKVHWITISDSAALNLELNDSIDNSGTDRWAVVLAANLPGNPRFVPPMTFEKGIYLDVSTATCKIVIGYE